MCVCVCVCVFLYAASVSHNWCYPGEEKKNKEGKMTFGFESKTPKSASCL